MQVCSNAIYESVASDTLTSQSLNKSDLNSKVRSIIRGLGNPALHVDFDEVYGTFQNPHSDLTYLENLELLRKDILARLLKVQQAITTQGDDATADPRKLYATYAKALSRESSPIKRAAIRREAKEQHYGTKLIEAAARLLPRSGPTTTPVNEHYTLINSIRKKAGSKLTSTQKEYEGISEHYNSLERTAREHYERNKSNRMKRR